MRRCLGILWPPHVFEAEEGRKPTNAESTKVSLDGKTHVGVLRKRSCGEPEGAYEVYDDARSFGSRTIEMAATRCSLTPYQSKL